MSKLLVLIGLSLALTSCSDYFSMASRRSTVLLTRDPDERVVGMLVAVLDSSILFQSADPSLTIQVDTIPFRRLDYLSFRNMSSRNSNTVVGCGIGGGIGMLIGGFYGSRLAEEGREAEGSVSGAMFGGVCGVSVGALASQLTVRDLTIKIESDRDIEILRQLTQP